MEKQRSGSDGRVTPVSGHKPSQWQVGRMDPVPGACAPINNIYHASQALSWIASRQVKMEKRLKRMGEIYALVDELLPG